MNLSDILAEKIAAKKATIVEGKDGLFTWFNKYLDHYIDKGFSEFHHNICARIDALRTSRNQRQVVIVPRGYAKSTFCTLANPLKCICEGAEPYILLVADTQDMAEKYLKHVKEELETNLKLRKMYPSACEGKVWASDRIETNNGVCVEALGKGKNARGRRFKQHRPTLIIIDDPQSSEDVNSPTTRAKDVEWFNRELLPAGDKGTNIFVVGNCIHRDSIVGKLETRQDFRAVKFSAIMEWPTNMDLWKEWEHLYTIGASVAKADYEKINRQQLLEGAKVLWDDKENIFELMKLRADIGHAAFEAEKQNNPKDPAKSEFPEEWISPDRAEIWYDVLPTGVQLITIGYVDAATGTDSKRGDDSAIITLKYSPSERRCYVEVNSKKRPIPTLLTDIETLHLLNKYDVLGFESNGFQAMISEEFYARNSRITNVVQVENYGIKKETRINRLGVWLEKAFFKFKRNCSHTKKLMQQLMDHPRAEHDDCSDALECAVRLLTSYIGEDNTPIQHQESDGLGDYLITDYR